MSVAGVAGRTVSLIWILELDMASVVPMNAMVACHVGIPVFVLANLLITMIALLGLIEIWAIRKR